MSKGGKRNGSGRKRIGISIHTRVDEDMLKRIEREVSGKSRADKIRNCLKIGLENNNIDDKRININGENKI